MARLFGTDGVRGVANTELTGDLAFRLGRAGAYVLTKEKKHAPRILVAMDTRISGDMLESALVAGICSVGAHAVVAGVIPTPAVAYLVRKYRLDAGVMISASHNPVEYNGIKFFDNQGYKLSDELEDEIEDILMSRPEILPSPTGIGLGTKGYAEEALDDYLAFLTKTTKERFGGIKVALDCANGAAYKAAPLAMLDLGAQLCIIHNDPDGTNINDKCGSTHMDDLKKLVVENGADIGFAFDGDADRCLAVDEKGELIDGDKILAICGLDMKQRGELKKDTIVGTVMSNLGLIMMGRENGIDILQTAVGDRYVLERMLADGYNIGGEQSGHVIFLDHNSTGDGVLTAIQLLSVLKRSGKKASELANIMQVMPQVLVNARVNNAKKNSYMDDEEVRKGIEELEKEFSQDGRVLIRTSGTEPLVRVMIEGKDIEKMDKAARKLASLIEERLK
ncbi:MAG: phosphoglucosamine mutase [Anaerotignum sp.]|nr:phosphoglucosamine mutase [Anaerotignum sp.]